VTRPDPLPPFDLGRFHTKPLAGGATSSRPGASPGRSRDGVAADFVASLPAFLGAQALRDLARAIVHARRGGRPVVWGWAATS